LVRLACLFAQALGFKAASKITCEAVEALVARIPDGASSRSRFSLKGLSDRLQLELQGDART
jgi:hypothetical protein